MIFTALPAKLANNRWGEKKSVLFSERKIRKRLRKKMRVF